MQNVYTPTKRDLLADSARAVAEKLPDSMRQDVLGEAWSRGKWLLGLLVLQSMSSVVLDSYQELLQEHLVITLFLTMLVGAGGNAGNQSAIKVRRLAPAARARLRRNATNSTAFLLVSCMQLLGETSDKVRKFLRCLTCR